MQHSKSLGSFAFNCVDSDRDALICPNRPRRRSSLDNLVIPGRLRVPSHKSESFDVQVTQNLLQLSMAQPKDPPPYMAETDSAPPDHSHNPSPQGDTDPFVDRSDDRSAGQQSVYRLAERSTPQRNDRDDIAISPRRLSQPTQLSSNNPFRRSGSPPAVVSQLTYDGVHDYSNESRITSTTWSTVSKVSHRIFSDSSSSSREFASVRYNHEYNHLATKHGLPEFHLSAHDNMSDRPSVRSNTKHLRSGWFARKFLPRNSTTYTYRARTTFKPGPRKKKSFVRSSSVSEDSRRNILEGKTLEETCKLGGLGVLILPEQYTVNVPTLPTCLSATATYLSYHGVNAPGLFRVSGQNSIVNALYDYYAHQFGHAGSPTKVQATVQPGQLPLHIEYTLPDIATFFKKVLKGLPGGLLGSLETFEAIQGILLRLEPDGTLTSDGKTMLRAKLIALNLLSISSLQRFNLIQAVLGLFAYFGDEAEKARVKTRDNTDKTLQGHGSSELMGYQALGVCLGPLLIGDLLENAGAPSVGGDVTPVISTESNGQPKKKGSSILRTKLSTPVDFAALVDRANLTANVMQLLLLIWRDVVKQLRVLTAPNKVAQHKAGHRKPSKHSIRVTDEELQFLDILRGGKLPENFPPEMLVKTKVKAKSRVPTPRRVIQPSQDSSVQREWFHEHRSQKDDEIVRGVRVQRDRKPTATLVQPSIEESGSYQEERTLPRHVAAPWVESHVETDSDEMSSGQILPPPDEKYRLFPQAWTGHRTPCNPPHTPTRREKPHRATSSTPEAHVKGKIDSDGSIGRASHRRVHTLDRPPPKVKKGLPPPPVEPPLKRDAPFPPRHSSLEGEASIERSNPLESRQTSIGGRSQENETPPSSTRINEGARPALSDQSQYHQARNFRSSTPNSGKGKVLKDPAPKYEIPLIPCFEDLSPSTPEGLSAGGASSNAPRSKDTLIPAPVANLGRQRGVPQAPPAPPKRDSIYHVPRIDTDSASQRHAHGSPKTPSDRGTDHVQDSMYRIMPTRPLSVQSLGALRPHLESIGTESSQWPHLGQHSRDTSRSGALSQTGAAVSVNQPSEITSNSRSRVPTNSTLYEEITRLKRQLEQKEEVILATRRSLEAAVMAKVEGPSPTSSNATPKRGSWSKGTLSHEVREAKKQRDLWKQRAAEAEKRLAGAERGGSRGRTQGVGRERISGEAWVKEGPSGSGDNGRTPSFLRP